MPLRRSWSGSFFSDQATSLDTSLNSNKVSTDEDSSLYCILLSNIKVRKEPHAAFMGKWFEMSRWCTSTKVADKAAKAD